MKQNRKESFLKIGTIYTVSNMIVKGLAFLTTPFFTRIMSQDEYGLFSNIASWASIISILMTFNLYSSISRAKYDYNDEIEKYMCSILLAGILVSIAWWGIVEANICFFESVLSIDRTYIRFIMFYSLLTPPAQILLAKYRMYGQYKQVVLVTWVLLLFSTISSVVLVLLLPDKLYGRVFGNYVVVAIVNVAFAITILINGHGVSFKHIRHSLLFALPLIPHELSGILLGSSDRIIINRLCGSTDVAVYSLGYTISMVATVFLSSLNQAWIPCFFDNLNEKKIKNIKKMSNKYMLFFVVGITFFMFWGPELIFIFGGKEYAASMYIVPPVCYAVLLQFVYTLYVNIEFYEKRTYMISIATVLATIINIVLNYVFIPIFGYIAAAYTTVAGFFFMMVFHMLAVSKTSEYRDVFSKKNVAVALVVAFMCMIVSIILYSDNTFRYIFATIYLTILLFTIIRNRSRLKVMFYK